MTNTNIKTLISFGLAVAITGCSSGMHFSSDEHGYRDRGMIHPYSKTDVLELDQSVRSELESQYRIYRNKPDIKSKKPEGMAVARPQDPVPKINLGAIYYSEGDSAEAAKELGSVRKTTIYTDKPNLLGVYIFQKGDVEGAKDVFQRAISARPHDPVPKINLGAVHYLEGDFIGVVKVLAPVYSKGDTTSESSMMYGDSLCHSGRSSDGEAVLYKAMKTSNGSRYHMLEKMVTDCITKEALSD